MIDKEQIWKAIISITLLASIVCFGLGMYFPIFSTHTHFIVKFGYVEVNVFDSIKMFFDSNDYFIGIIILLFTFIIPLCNYIVLLIQITSGKTFKYLPDLNKWSMLDVFVVALILINFKMQSTSSIMIMQLQIGTTYIAIAVLLRMIVLIQVSINNILRQN